MPRFLRVMLPLAFVFLFGFILEYRAEVGADRARFLTQETSVIQHGLRQIERELEAATWDLFFVAELVSRGDLFFVAELVSRAVDDDAAGGRAPLEQSLLALLRHRTNHAQLRFISATGQEILRVENAAGGPRVVDERELQDKGNRSYFTDTMRLKAGELFVSPMELNVERGEIEKPYQSVLRLATPIHDSAGQRQGIVVLNVHGGRFLRGFERNPERGGVQRMIVNSDGYWLQHRPEVEWGFMLEHGKGFHSMFPDVWAQMVAIRQGQIESSDGDFYFDTVSPRPPALSAGATSHGQSDWLLISLVPRKVLDGIAVRVATRLLVIAMPLFFALLLVGLLLAAALEKRRLSDEALRSVEQMRSAMMRAALDAIVVMDEAGTTLEFNPMAQRIFGYTLEEARGKLVADLIIPPAHREAHRVGLEHYLETGEGPIIDKHIDDLSGIRKDGSEFPVELTVCPIIVSGRQLFFGFLRDLSERRSEAGEEKPA